MERSLNTYTRPPKVYSDRYLHDHHGGSFAGGERIQYEQSATPDTPQSPKFRRNHPSQQAADGTYRTPFSAVQVMQSPESGVHGSYAGRSVPEPFQAAQISMHQQFGHHVTGPSERKPASVTYTPVAKTKTGSHIQPCHRPIPHPSEIQ